MSATRQNLNRVAHSAILNERSYRHNFGETGMMNIDTSIDKAPPEYRGALKAEKETYTRIHETTKVVLAEVGIETKNEEVISLLEATGLAGYDPSIGRIYLLPDLIDQCLESAAKTFAGDEGLNTLGIGGIPPFLYRKTDQYPMPAT
jgi:trimethylamine:corrinoid methyltransferase-like protein